MRMSLTRTFLPWVLVLAITALSGDRARGEAAAPPPKPSTEPENLTPQQRQQMTALAKQALGTDPAASMKAVKELDALGEPAKPRLQNVVKTLLLRDRDLVIAAGHEVGDSAKAKALGEEIATVRKAARENIAKLAHDETMKVAHENYDKLAKMQALLNETFVVRDAVRTALVRRAPLWELWTKLGGTDPKLTAALEEKLKGDAVALLGLSLEDVLKIPEFGAGGEPADPVAHEYWFYGACRRIEAYNKGLEKLMSAGEFENLSCLNAYRESLGIMPLEVDPRLLQSARRHSKEMVEKGYFAHESPTPSEKTLMGRMRNAGYNNGRSENIANGSASGKAAFLQWFDSPPHHKNMVDAGSSAFGVGQWGSTWTQNFGTSPRLMFLDPAERDKQVPVKGEIVPPHGGK